MALELHFESRPIEEIEKVLRRHLSVFKAFERIDNGFYGYCLETDESIGLRCLEANLMALYCIEYQDLIEKVGVF